MNFMDFVYLFLALVAGGVILAFVVQPGSIIPVTPLSTLMLTTNTSSLASGETVQVHIYATHLAGNTIQFTDGEHAHAFACDSDPCAFDQSFSYSTAGKHVLTARAGSLSSAQTLIVTNSQRVCIDGTYEGACSNVRPQRCTDAALVDDCSACGCPIGQVCVSTHCQAAALELGIDSLVVPSPTYATAPTSISLALTNLSESPASGLVVLVLTSYDSSRNVVKTFPQQVLVDAVAPGMSQSFTLTPTLSESTHFVGIEVYPAEHIELSSRIAASELIPISVRVDTTPPGAPAHLRVQGDSATRVLAWDDVSAPDVHAYVIYQQSLATGGFTTYQRLGETTHLTYELPSSSSQIAYVVRARDDAGNEGLPSDPVVVPASG